MSLFLLSEFSNAELIDQVCNYASLTPLPPHNFKKNSGPHVHPPETNQTI
jgi:hypothetical protein